jgi:hypothetical protein
MSWKTGGLALAASVAFVVGCAGETEEVKSSNGDGQLRRGWQSIGFSCRCETDGCRVEGLMELLGQYETRAPETIHVQPEGANGVGWSGTDFVASRAAIQPRPLLDPTAQHFAGLSTAIEIAPYSAAEVLVGASVFVEQQLLAEGDEFDEFDIEADRPFGYLTVKTPKGDLHDYSCEGLWRETRGR